MTDSFIVRVPTLKKELVYKRLEHNHAIFDWLVEQMPIKTFLYGTLVSGWMISVMLSTKSPTNWQPGSEVIEDLVKMPVGRVNIFMPTGRCLSWGCKYGKITEPMSYPTVCQVRDEDLPILVEVGKAVWRSISWTKEIIKAEFVRAD